MATRRDLDHAVEVLRAEMATTRSDLRAEMATTRSDLRAEMATLASGLRVEMATVGIDARTQLRSLFLGLLTLQLTGAGLALAVARLV